MLKRRCQSFKFAPPILRIGPKLKVALGCTCEQQVVVDGQYLLKDGGRLQYHDLYHLEVASLAPIQMGADDVSGIHGINSSIYHRTPIKEQYDSALDEARVAIHEWLTRPTAYNSVKFIAWFGWLSISGINAIAVTHRHYQTLKQHPNLFTEIAIKYFNRPDISHPISP